MAVDAYGMPVRFLVTEGTSADCRSAIALIEGFQANFLLADRAYDTEEVLAKTGEIGAEAVVPSRSNRRHQREIDLHIYKQRHVIENAFEKLKRWRGIATRYCKRLSSFVAAVQIRCLTLWLKIL